MNDDAAVYAAKARESLAGAVSELAIIKRASNLLTDAIIDGIRIHLMPGPSRQNSSP